MKSHHESEVKIYAVDDCFVASENGVWIEGAFETEEAAQYMLGLSVENQSRTWENWCSKHTAPYPPIGLEDLQKEATT